MHFFFGSGYLFRTAEIGWITATFPVRRPSST